MRSGNDHATDANHGQDSLVDLNIRNDQTRGGHQAPVEILQRDVLILTPPPKFVPGGVERIDLISLELHPPPAIESSELDHFHESIVGRYLGLARSAGAAGLIAGRLGALKQGLTWSP
jgi:hypothetical protein